jgi:hypothetical protein
MSMRIDLEVWSSTNRDSKAGRESDRPEETEADRQQDNKVETMK